MTRRLWRYQVEGRATELLKNMDVSRPPVNVERIARKLGYGVIFEHFPSDLSATLIRDKDGSVTLGINSFHPRTRQRFSIAHEIGHGELHVKGSKLSNTMVFVDPPGPHVLFRDDTASRGEDPQEIQANQFAAALLMPESFIEDVVRRILSRRPSLSEGEVIAQLATRFDVSEQAMRYRLVTLGVVEPE